MCTLKLRTFSRKVCSACLLLSEASAISLQVATSLEYSSAAMHVLPKIAHPNWGAISHCRVTTGACAGITAISDYVSAMILRHKDGRLADDGYTVHLLSPMTVALVLVNTAKDSLTK